jgi:hypothetical protein
VCVPNSCVGSVCIPLCSSGTASASAQTAPGLLTR